MPCAAGTVEVWVFFALWPVCIYPTVDIEIGCRVSLLSSTVFPKCICALCWCVLPSLCVHTDLPVAYQLSCEECRLQIPDDEVDSLSSKKQMFFGCSASVCSLCCWLLCFRQGVFQGLFSSVASLLCHGYIFFVFACFGEGPWVLLCWDTRHAEVDVHLLSIVYCLPYTWCWRWSSTSVHLFLNFISFSSSATNRHVQVSWFTIDGEMYEAQSVNIKLLPKKLKIFVPER